MPTLGLKGGPIMTKKENDTEPLDASKDGAITRRTAMKRIAVGLAGAGIVIATGRIVMPREASAAYFDQGYSAYASWHPYSSNG